MVNMGDSPGPMQIRPAAAGQRAIDFISGFVPRLKPLLQTQLIRAIYSGVSILLKNEDTAFLNYGYSSLAGEPNALQLQPDDQPNRLSIELYNRVVGARDLRGRDVLEVGCGRGGGASFVARYHGPASVVGVDLSKRAVRYCRRRHRDPRLTFLRGDAERLEFTPDSFDVVVNVESSHTYPSFEGFLDEVARVLRPNGFLLYADFRPHDGVALMREQLARRFDICEEEEITENVVRALERDSHNRRELIQKRAPAFLQEALQAFAGVKGSRTFQLFARSELRYLRFVLRSRKIGDEG